MTAFRRRGAANAAIAAAALALVASITLTSGRTQESRGYGYDGQVYAAMMVDSLDEGGANARMRPLVILTNQLAYDFVFHEPIRTFQAMNFVYTGLLALVLCAILDGYGVAPAHKLVFALNVFATIAVAKMFAFYPILLDLGAYLWVTLAIYAILRGGRAAIVATTVLAVFAREFGLVAVLFGIHRDLRRRLSPVVVVATYLPAVVGFFALRQWVMASVDTSVRGLEGGLLSSADVIANARYLVDPLFLVTLGYFTLTIFGGISLLLLVRAVRRQMRLGGETEWLTYLGVVAALTMVGNADMWRYLAYALPAVAALYAKSLAMDDWRLVAPWAALVTVVTQQPWATMNDVSYFYDWFPLYLPLFGVPDDPSPQFWTSWTIRLAVVACLCVCVWVAQRPPRVMASAHTDVPSQLPV
jgi:hypothetical protein